MWMEEHKHLDPAQSMHRQLDLISVCMSGNVQMLSQGRVGRVSKREDYQQSSLLVLAVNMFDATARCLAMEKLQGTFSGCEDNQQSCMLIQVGYAGSGGEYV